MNRAERRAHAKRMAKYPDVLREVPPSEWPTLTGLVSRREPKRAHARRAMRVTHVSEPRGNFVDVVVRFDGEITMDGVVAARDWLREQLGVESNIGIVMGFAPSRAVLSVPVALEARVRAMICDPSADTEGSGA